MKTFIIKHLAFILTFSVTYLIGILLIIAQCCATNQTNESIEEIIFSEICLNSIIPTTITYVLGCILVNIVEILQNKENQYIFNIITCLAVFMYALLFTIYLMKGFSKQWQTVEFFLTALLLILNILCYKEKCTHRNHGLV